MADANHHISEVASSIASPGPEVFTLKHSALLALLLMKELHLGESSPSRSHHHAVISMLARDDPTGQVSGGKPLPNNMSVSCYYVQDLQQVLWAKAEGIERWTCQKRL